MAEALLKDLHFPKAGLDLSQAFGRQPNRETATGYSRTAPVAVNVRSFDARALRERGGTRCGLTRVMVARVGSRRWVIQELNAMVGSGFDQGDATVQDSIQGRVVTGIAVVQGRIYSWNPGDSTYTASTNATGENPPLNYSGIMFSAPNIQQLWLVDGINMRRYDPRTNTVYDWVVTAGTQPLDEEGNAPRLIETWRGRTCVAGYLEDPAIINMSRVGNPLDYSYFPTPDDPQKAVFLGPTSTFGTVSDSLTCLAAFNDDVLLIGCSRSLYRLQGDPAAGGQVDLISKEIGVAWGRPFTQDPAGNLYFFANPPGVYVVKPNSMPVRISQPIESKLQDVNSGTHHVRLAYHDRLQEVRVFITKLSEAAETEHYCYSLASGAWFQDVFADEDHNPLALCVIDGNRPEDRTIVLGSWDGFLRAVDHEAEEDDGVPIQSEVVIGPILTKNYDELAIDQLQAVLGEESGDVKVEFLSGATAEAALAADPILVGTLESGRSLVFPARVRGHAVYVRLTSTKAWQMEMIRVRLAGKGKVGMRQR